VVRGLLECWDGGVEVPSVCVNYADVVEDVGMAYSVVDLGFLDDILEMLKAEGVVVAPERFDCRVPFSKSIERSWA